MSYKIDTLCVQSGYKPKTGESRIPPVVQSTTYVYEKTQDMADLFDLKSDGYFYTRLANPTVAAFEGKVAALEGGVAAIGCASGMSATTLAAFTVCGAGDQHRFVLRDLRRHFQPLCRHTAQTRHRMPLFRRGRARRRDRKTHRR